MPSNLSERAIQAKLLGWVLDKRNHELAVPNITTIYYWECDLLSMTRAEFVHEYEIKRSVTDYRADFKGKRGKHDALINRSFYYNSVIARIPNYFWFVTADFDIEPPEYAGWIRIVDTGSDPDIWVKKNAPRLHNQKLQSKKIRSIGNILSYRLKNFYLNEYGSSNENKSTTG